MKNISIIFTLLFTMFLTGCGSNSKPDSGGENTALSNVVELEGQKIIQAPNGIDFSLTMPFKKLIAEAYHVKLSGFSLEVAGGCSINSIGYTPATALEFDGGEDSVETLYVSGAFDANCTPTGYTLSATQKITQNGQSDTRQVSFTYDYNNPDGGGSVTPPSEDGYSFYNATTPLEITQPNTPYSIKVQLLKEGHTAEGETVKLRPIEDNNNFKYGKIESNTVSTGG